MGRRHGNPPRQPPQEGIVAAQSHLARSQRLCLHNDVPHHSATSPLGARKSWRGQRRQSHLRRRTHSAPCASCPRPHAKFALASSGTDFSLSSFVGANHPRTETEWQTTKTTIRNRTKLRNHRSVSSR